MTKLKLALAGICLSFVGWVLMIVKVVMKAELPDYLRIIAAICLAIGIISNLTVIHEARKQNAEDSGKRQP